MKLVPTKEDFKSILAAKNLYEETAKTSKTSPLALCATAGAFKASDVFRYLLAAITLNWKELAEQLKDILKYSEIPLKDIEAITTALQNDTTLSSQVTAALTEARAENSEPGVTEAIEKHDSLNNLLFTKEMLLRDRVRDKMFEIVNAFLEDLAEQNITLKVEDILLVGSNASYNYNSDSDIDLHIITKAKDNKYDIDVAEALYSAYRTLFNRQLDIKILGIPLEIYVEIENSPRVSNGVYSVKYNKWVKKPRPEVIPEYDKKALANLVDLWEAKCKKLLAAIKADKLDTEVPIINLLEDIYAELRKKGVSKSEYAIENLAFKELRNKGYLDKLKNARNLLKSKRLSLEEQVTGEALRKAAIKISQITHSQPQVLEDGNFCIYNVKESDKDSCVGALCSLNFITEVYITNNGKYDFSQVGRTGLPTQYYNIRGKIKL